MNISYDEIENAMETDPMVDLTACLDGETGAVYVIDEYTKEQAGAYQKFDDIPREDGHIRVAWIYLWENGELGESMSEADEQAADDFWQRLIRIPRADSQEAYQDMERFVATVQNPALAEQLEQALGGRGSFRRFKDVLARFPAEQERWYAYSEQQKRRRIDEWLWSEGVLDEEQIGQGDVPATADNQPLLHLLNFAHPLTAAQIEQLQVLVGTEPDVREIAVHFNHEQSFAEQVTAVVDRIEMTPAAWQTEQFLIVPPGYAPAASVLLAELHGRMGYFPSIVRLKPVSEGGTTHFEVAELVNLQQARDAARLRRRE